MFGGGGFFDFFKRGEGAASKIKGQMVSGFDKDQLAAFKRMGATLASAKTRTDIEKNAPSFMTKRVLPGETNPLSNSVSKDQMESLVKAFRLRQDEVFGRRARPGIAAQTRNV